MAGRREWLPASSNQTGTLSIRPTPRVARAAVVRGFRHGRLAMTPMKFGAGGCCVEADPALS